MKLENYKDLFTQEQVYEFIEEIKSTPAMGMLPIWPYKLEPPAEVGEALLQWIVDTNISRIWHWFMMGFGVGIALILMVLALLKCSPIPQDTPSITFDAVRVEFSEPMDTVGLFDPNNYIVSTGPDYDQMPIDLTVHKIIVPPGTNPDSIMAVIVFTDEHPTGVPDWVISVINVRDRATVPNYINLEKNYKVYNGND